MPQLELDGMPDAVHRVAAVLSEAGHAAAPRCLPLSPSAPAAALGVALGQVVRCSVFQRTPDNAVVLVAAAGDRTVNPQLVAALVAANGQQIHQADADFIAESTGQPLGGVTPFGLAPGAIVLIDRSLSRFEDVWLPCGDPAWVVQMQPQELEWLTEAPVVDVVMHPDDETLAREEAVRMVLARAATVSDTGDFVPSPCISVCRINATSSVCEGCFRTLGEISAWGRSSADAKRKLWLTIRERLLHTQT